MKRLTMNQVARANLRHNRKAYLSLAIGIFLAVYLACTAVLLIYGTLEANSEKAARKVSWGDTTLLNEPDVTDDQLRSSGYFDQIGRIYVTADAKRTGFFTDSMASYSSYLDFFPVRISFFCAAAASGVPSTTYGHSSGHKHPAQGKEIPQPQAV